MSTVWLTSEARKDIADIGRFIYESSGDLQTALGFLDRIDKKCKLIASSPGAGEARPDLGPGIRMLIVKNYVGFYRVIPNGIELLMITHGSRDVPRAFRERFRSKKNS